MITLATNLSDMAHSDKDSPDRDDYVRVLLTEEEKTELRVKAARQNLTMSEYIRDLVFGEEQAVPA